jgi:hypothetical protein
MTTKRIDFGEYSITIDYEKESGYLEVIVYDELGDIIESISIQNDEDDDLSLGDVNLNLD